MSFRYYKYLLPFKGRFAKGIRDGKVSKGCEL